MSGGKRGDKSVHPNDHVNRGQSSNDVIPTAIHLAALDGIVHHLIPALKELHAALEKKSREFAAILKVGRTHLQDATPIYLGQEFGGYASQIEHGIARLESSEKFLGELSLGGTAVGTGINTHLEFSRRTIEGIARETKLNLREAANHFEAQGAIDALVETSGTLKTVAVSLIKIANDIRWLGSGPRCGLGELRLPANEPGSSIMPGKVNPTQCEALIMVCLQVMAADGAVAMAAAGGNFELNTLRPLIVFNVLHAARLLADAGANFLRYCVAGLEPDRRRIAELVERSLMLVTALAPEIGYDRAAAIAHHALREDLSLRQAALASGFISAARFDELVDPARMAAGGALAAKRLP
ncbi:MAG: lyase family protein [Terriglobales bacterium]